MVTERVLFAAEVVFVVAAVVGVGIWSIPAALVAGGTLGLLACERASAEKRAAAQRHGRRTTGGDQA
ncbi:hypothetical protein AB0P17_36615 [Streptomyces sp. NPDC088124]|uniref:hypothetical protein n=1 Tax=Streptomyces sp. NPDC088124 TaxID=3154654 RepID=UPI00341975F2